MFWYTLKKTLEDRERGKTKEVHGNLIRMSRKYKRDGAYTCKKDWAYPFWSCIMMFVGAVMIVLCLPVIKGSLGAVVYVFFAVVFAVVGLVRFIKWINSPSVELKRGHLAIKYKYKEIGHDIKSVDVKLRPSALYIIREKDINLNEVHVFPVRVTEIVAFACLINCLKENELGKLENLTLDEFPELCRKSLM